MNETENENLNPTTEEVEEPGVSSVQVGITPWGHIGINVIDPEGNGAGHIIDDPQEAWALAGHILSLATMMVQTRYAMAMKEQQLTQEILRKPDLYVAGRS